jgi:adenylate cyclase
MTAQLQQPNGEVHAQLARILASREFAGSPQLAQFLRFVVEETLAGRQKEVKAYTIGLKVFHRPPSFDPQSDTIVRVEGSRLRRKLDHYYLTEGREDGVRIDLPPGGYVPRITVAAEADSALSQTASPVQDPLSTRRRWWRLLAGVAVVLLVAGLGMWSFWPLAPQRDSDLAMVAGGRPSEAGRRITTIAVSPFRNLSGDPSQDYFSFGLTEEIISRLTRFRDIRVASTHAAAETPADEAMHQDMLARGFASFLLDGSVRREGSRVRVTAKLLDLNSGEYRWATDYDRSVSVGDLIDIQDDIAKQIVAAVAQPYGVVTRVEMEKLQRAGAGNLAAYECILWTLHYWAHISPDNHRKGRDCLEEAVIRDPTYARAWAYLAYYYLDEYRWRFNPRPGLPSALERANIAARRAGDLDPDSAVARLALAAVAFFNGDLALFRSYGEAALRMNPSDPEHMASFGARLAYSGDWERGLALVHEAIALNPWHPDWYRLPLIYDAYRRGHYDDALAELKKINLPYFYTTHVLGAMIWAELGDRKRAAASLNHVLALYPDFAERARDDFRTWNFDDALTDRFMGSLRNAGLVVSG